METAKEWRAGDAFNSLAHHSLPLRGRIVSYRFVIWPLYRTRRGQRIVAMTRKKEQEDETDDLNLLTQIGWLGDKTELWNEIMLLPARMDRPRMTKSCKSEVCSI